MQPVKTSVAVVDDHVPLRHGLCKLIRSLETYSVLFEADNGKDFMNQLKPTCIPDIVLLNINMPEMDGYETALWIKRNYPDIKVLALSYVDNESAVIRMTKNGAKATHPKEVAAEEFGSALDALMRKGFYYSELITGKLIHAVNQLDEPEQTIKSLINLNDREIEFLKLACTEMTYKEIADRMYLSPRTIDGYRDNLFEKLNAKTRVGLVIYAIRNGVVSV